MTMFKTLIRGESMKRTVIAELSGFSLLMVALFPAALGGSGTESLPQSSEPPIIPIGLAAII